MANRFMYVSIGLFALALTFHLGALSAQSSIDCIVAADAYNGTTLWALETPHFERFNVPRDCSNWCADQDAVYAAVRDRLGYHDLRAIRSEIWS